MDTEIAKAINYSERLLQTAIDAVGGAKVDMSREGTRDPKIVALSIFCRSITNFRAALLLVQQRHVMEAKTLGRCLYENLLWIGALRERGREFVQDMLKDEAFNRQSIGELTLRLSKKHGADVDSPGSLTLRSIIKDVGKNFPETKKLSASKTAAEGVIEIAYVEYAKLSLESVHCSITALGRHVHRERISEHHTELVVSVEPEVSESEMLSTILLLCRALMGAAIGANEILGIPLEPRLNTLVTEFESNGWRVGV